MKGYEKVLHRSGCSQLDHLPKIGLPYYLSGHWLGSCLILRMNHSSEECFLVPKYALASISCLADFI